MAYFVNKTDGTAIVVLDGTKDITSTSLTLIGRLATNYGEVQNENFLHLLENFAFATAPAYPIQGQLWFDTSTDTVKVRTTGTTWVEIGSNLTTNLYLDSNLFVGGNTLQIVENSGNVSITNIKNDKNIILRTNVSGIVSDALKINGNTGLITVLDSPIEDLGVATKNYVDGLESYVDALLIDINSNIASVNSNIQAVNSNLTNTNSSLSGLTSNISLGSGAINAQSIQLSGNTIISRSGVGNTIVDFYTPEGLNFISAYGTVSSNLITVSGQWVLAAGATLNSSYADIAEYYATDFAYGPGTVLVFDGPAEVTTTSAENDTKLAGVVSTNPAYIMNQALDKNKVCIALQGRVPCKVIGPVRKGDLLTTSIMPGYAIATVTPAIGAIVGKSLENNEIQGPCVVEISVGRS